MTVDDLQHELRLRGYSTKGLKDRLVLRLELRLQNESNVEQKKSSTSSGIRKSTRNK